MGGGGRKNWSSRTSSARSELEALDYMRSFLQNKGRKEGKKRREGKGREENEGNEGEKRTFSHLPRSLP